MTDPLTRRGFLQRAGAAGGLLALGGPRPTATVAPPPVNAPIIVVTQSVSRDVNPRGPTWGYITEVLRRGGLFFEQLSPDRLESLFRRPKSIVLLSGNLRLTAAARATLAAWVKGGGALIGIGGTSGLDEVFGVIGGSPLAEGWMKVTAVEHPITAGLRSSLHVFGGYVMTKGSATALTEVQWGKRPSRGCAILENRFGRGHGILLGPDLVFSIVHMQQGVSVLQDGKPAPDDSAPINDGILKAEDGLVLDWVRDRRKLSPDDGQVFLEPISDELREIILRSIFHAAAAQGIALAVLWYWPRSLAAVGHISHDTDGNDPKRAVALLEVMNRLKMKSTWCTLYPGGYPREFYRTLASQGFEIGLHYDAKTGGPETSWSKEDFFMQHRWLMNEAGLRHITTNKNHYTRWEGRLDFFRWCEEIGIESDQSRGMSKKGTIGFPLGGSQPYFPWDDEAALPRLLNVLEVNLLTQDLVVVCPGEYGRPLVDSVLRHHGAAHFLFHPHHILERGVADALSGLVEYGRSMGLEWWASAQIHAWETLRRGVAATFDGPGGITLRAAKPLQQATILFLKIRPRPQSITVNGRPAAATRRSLYGFEFDAVTLDVAGEIKVQVA
jgi:hypothetical protein